MKTKLFSLLVALCAASDLFAYDFKYGDLYYNILNDNEVEVTYEKEAECEYCVGSDNYTELKSVEIPSSVIHNGGTYNVVSIGPNAFLFCTGLISITIPKSVTTIGYAAFRYCSNLTSISIPNTIKSIGARAFYSCDNLASITIPNGVQSIESETFSYCYSLSSITIPNSVTSIGYSAFEGCTSLTFVTIPNSVTSIGRSAFEGCTSLTSVTIPNSVTSIGDYAFYCTGLTSITIPNSVTSIGYSAFCGCFSLTSITIPNSVTSIGYSAFSNCRSLTSITIPNSVTRITGSTFEDCTSLTSVTIPNSVTSIGESAFSGCRRLTSITIPNSVTSIGSYAFASCNKLNQLIVLAPVPPKLGNNAFNQVQPTYLSVLKCYLDDYQSIKWGGFSADKYSTYKLPVSVSSADITLGYTKSMPMDSLMDCGDSIVVQAYPSSTAPFAFWSDGCIDNPHTIAIPDSGINLKAYFAKGLACGEAAQWQYANGVLSITGTGAMYDYTWDNVPWRLFRDSIRQVNIAEGITSIEACCFTGLSRLTNVTLPNSITRIGDKALSGNSNLEVVVTGENIDTMGDSVFVNTPRIYQIVCKTQRVPTISANTFAGMSNRVPIYVFATSVNKYRVHEYWGRQNICSLGDLTTYTVTATCDPQYGIVTGSGTYFEGESVTLTATPNSGYMFVCWSNGNTDNPYTFAAESNLTIEAQFTSSTDVENVATMPDATPRKVLRNGQVFVIENGKLYNMLGQEVPL